jgi:aspartoacylase
MGRVLVVAATHGNERNGGWLLEGWRQDPDSLRRSGLAVEFTIGNPAAWAACRRYLDRDLNRSFEPSLLADPAREEREVGRARELLEQVGPEGQTPCLVAAGLQQQLGLPIYLHEGDPAQTGYLAERWPCGLVIEVGPVPQGVLTALLVRQTQLAVEETLAQLALARAGRQPQPRALVVHRHLGSLDLPRDAAGTPLALVHPRRQHRDWQPMRPGDPLFVDRSGATVPYRPPAGLEGEPVWPVFINEAAYGEKGIALGLTRREVWPVEPAWAEVLHELCAALEVQPAAG